ncbi:probable serine/threonine-protein kinase nek3 isoform X1 [Lucilia cuprina]|uniref:probable serine/threonine-protein kinase nek3 isoform X1 n=1 Tax=Lucilia cuprina TaxID=7375 RepID=UPI001F06ACEB|nr:probable serine/threonine-protein kinase nek3 isoform X1 [Lucilia cuprina]
MWQPSLNKNFYDTAAASYISGNNSQQDELAANLLHLQKLQLTDLLPPLAASNSTTAIPYHLQNTAATLNLSSPPATSFLNYFQQHLRALIQRQNLVTTTTTPFPPWSTSLAGNNSSNSNRHLLLASAAEVPEATFLTPPPPPAPLTTSTAQILDLLPLSLLTDSFLSLNPSYPPSLTSTYLPPSTSLSPNLSNPQQLKLYKQYLALEKAQLSNLINSKNFHHTPLNSINGYHSASLNLSQLTAPIPNLKTSSSTTSSINCDQLQQQQQKEQRALRKRRDNLKDLFLKQSQNSSTAINLTSDCDTDELLPPPKKKWIRHYLKEDANNTNNNSNDNNTTDTKNTSFMLLTNSTSSKLLKSSSSSSLSPPIQMATDDEEPEDVTMMKSKTAAETAATDGGNMSTFTLIGRNGEIIGNAAASKQMLLANGIRIAAPTATIGQVTQQPATTQVSLSKAINIPFNNKNIPLITGFPYQLTPTSSSPSTSQQAQQQTANGGSCMVLTNRPKTFIPLTPPPMSSRKFVEPTQSRIRSFSLSSHKLSANQHHQLHNGNNSNSMMVDEIPPTQQHHHSFGTNSSSSQHSTSSQHSPPRHVSSSLGASSAGSHYMHMLNAAGGQQSAVGAGSNHVTHATPRRRTISSTSNGAGTREVHNKLEKNRRAHLKECYEALKNQLSLKDEDRRKTSNLAILGEALKCVQTFQKRAQELEVESEHLANEKINLQKRIVSLKRELGPKYEQMFSGLGIFSDIEIGSIPNERETINDTHSLSSGRGSTLYSSSSSLSSGGSNGSSSGGSGSNTMSSPVGAGLQTAMPTTISPVINKINHNSNNNNINSTSPISINSNSNVVIQQQQRKNPTITTTIQAVAIPTQGGGGGGGISSPPAGSPTALVTFGSSLPLSLTAKNISATAVTRGSPTPSTPSPSPSSSSGVSSSSSLISSSPPINGVINNGRNVTVNIPNGLKLQATAAVAGAGLNGNGSGGGIAVSSLIAGGIGNGSTATAAATILATSAPAQGVNNTNNGKFPKIKILSTIN